MNVIAAVDSNWAIGYQNKLLVSIPNDMKFFRMETKGKVVVLGRKTLETFPGKRPLEQRTNIIVSSDSNYQVEGATVVNSIEALLEELKQYKSESIYIIGGTSIYKQMLPYCKVAHITKIHHAYAADSYFPNLDEMEEWVVTGDSEEQTYFDLEYEFLQYERKQ
ncbi:MAG: dihydrofolate reductase [Eubacteriales bacterium]